MQDTKERAIQTELERILDAPEFKNSNVAQRFLTFIVTETLAGREGDLKSVVVAQAVFDRGPEDDGAENAVRTTAVRLRSALGSANARLDEDRKVSIQLPKGRYVPAFEFHEGEAARRPQSGRNKLRTSPKWVGVLSVIALLTLVLFTPLIMGNFAHRPNEPVVVVRPTQAINQQSSELADEIERRLAPHMASIGLGRIMESGQDNVGATENGWPLYLRTRANAAEDEIEWDLIDSEGEIHWTGRERNGDRQQPRPPNRWFRPRAVGPWNSIGWRKMRRQARHWSFTQQKISHSSRTSNGQSESQISPN